MKTEYSRRMISLLVLVTASVATYAADVAPPAKRAAVVATAKALLEPSPADAVQVPTDAKNPFDPTEVKVDKGAKVNRPESDYDLLVLLAAQLNPSGMFIMGDSPILLLGQKKAKVGDKLSIPFDDVAYEVEITAIERNTFSLRFNKAEFTRSIQPGKTP
jgi:hypothetical protein